MCKFIRKSNERILCKLSKSEILRLYSIVHVAMETTKTSNFTCQSKSFISIFFTCQVSACELQPFSCLDLANDTYSQTTKTVVSHLTQLQVNLEKICGTFTSLTTGTKLKTSKALNSAKQFSLMRIGTQLSVGRYSRSRFMDARYGHLLITDSLLCHWRKKFLTFFLF